jgi:hypothetical protein
VLVFYLPTQTGNFGGLPGLSGPVFPSGRIQGPFSNGVQLSFLLRAEISALIVSQCR